MKESVYLLFRKLRKLFPKCYLKNQTGFLPAFYLNSIMIFKCSSSQSEMFLPWHFLNFVEVLFLIKSKATDFIKTALPYGYFPGKFTESKDKLLIGIPFTTWFWMRSNLKQHQNLRFVIVCQKADGPEAFCLHFLFLRILFTWLERVHKHFPQ